MNNENNTSAVHVSAASEMGVVENIEAAWQATKGVKATIWGAIGLQILLLIGFAIISGALGSGIKDKPNAIEQLIGIISGIVSYLFGAGLIMLAVRRVQGQEIKAIMVFDYFSRWLSIILLHLAMGLLILIGFILLVLPGIYLTVAYTLALPVLLDKNMGIWEALETSRKAVSKKWFTYFFTYILFGLISLLAAIPLGIGLIWTLPMGLMLMAILYRRTFTEVSVAGQSY